MKKIIFILAAFFVTQINAYAEIPIVFEKSSAVPLVHLSIAFKVGASHDPKGLNGLTNFVGEMLLRGTSLKNKEAIDQTIDNLGASLSVDTRQEATVFRASVLSSELPEFLKLMTEMLTKPSFPNSEIEKLRKELISGLLESNSSDGRTAGRFFQKIFYKNHPYANPVLGTTASLKKINKKSIQEHYQKLMSTHSAIIIGAGLANESDIQEFSKSLEEGLPHGNNPETIGPVTGPSGLKIVIIDKPDRTQTQVMFGYQGITAKNPAYTAYSIGNYSFGGKAFSSRLFQEVRAKRGYSYFARSGLTLGTYPRAWQLSMAPAEKDTANTIQIVLDMVNEYRLSGITSEEFNFAQESLSNSNGFSYNTPAKRAENRLTEELLGLEKGWVEKSIERIQNTSLNEVNQAVHDNLNPNNGLILILGTAKNIKKSIADVTKIPENEIQVIPFDTE